MPDFAVRTAFTATDKLSPAFNKMGKGVDKFGRRTSRAFGVANKASSALFRQLKLFGSLAVVAGVGIVARQFVQFDDAIFGAAAKFGDLNIASKEGQATMDQLRKTARKVGEETKFNAVQAAQGLDFLALAGFNTMQAMASLPGVVSLATVANIDLATATDIATDSLGAFNLMSNDSAQLQKNLTRVNDVMAKTTASSNTNLMDLFESVKKGAPSFTAAGQSIETFSALIGTMANSGVKGSEAGTQLRNMMLRLVNSTAPARKVMSKLGITVKDNQGNFRDAVDIIADFENGLKGMGTAQRTQALATVFGARAVTGMNILLANGSEKLRLFRDDLVNSSGAANDMANIIEQSMGNKIKALTSALTELGFKFIETFSVDGKNGIDGLTESVRNFDPTPMIRGLEAIGMVLNILLAPLRAAAWLGTHIGDTLEVGKGPAIEKAIIKRPDLLAAAQRKAELKNQNLTGPRRAPNEAQLAANNSQTNIDINNKGVETKVTSTSKRNVKIKGDMGPN